MEDRDIVRLYWLRSESAIGISCEKYGNYCYSIAYNILADREDSEESVNDTWLGAWNSMPPHKPDCLSAFLGKITRRISIDKWRKKRAAKRGFGAVDIALDELSDIIADGESIESELERRHLAELISRFVSELEINKRRVFILRYFHLESIGEIAKRLGFTQSRVKSMLFRSREELRGILEKEGFI